jgi:uncharacterized protein with HEPN domain
MCNIPRDDTVRLHHMLEAAQKARSFVRDREKCDLESDEMLSLAVVRLLEILGEAATRVSAATQAMYPQIPWRQIAGTRNRLIHGYFNVDLDIVWAILEKDLPPLIAHLESITSAIPHPDTE